ncbi:MAG: hypothetical protein ABIR81_02905 [Ginsengibacter sp.]
MIRLLAFSMFLIGGCTSSITETTDTDSADSVSTTAPVKSSPQGCYAWQSGKDSAALNLQVAGGQISGTLSYNLFEKDKNKGTITGNIKDDLIIADYTFQSEGMTSVREVVFKIDGENLIEGMGDIDVDGDTARFKSKTELEFNTDRPFIKTACE